MGKTVQGIISKIFPYRRPLLLGLVLILVFSFVPLSVAHAGFWNGVINVVVGIVAKIFELFALILGAIFKTLSTVLIDIIKYFLGMTVTPGVSTTPSFVTTSFNFVRQFVNLFFILILVFIGLATILRLPSYQYQKTLRLLIIMALLINFSGVFVGFIADMSNLVSHYFLDKATGDWSKIAKPLVSLSGDQSQKLATAIASIIYYFVAILIYFVLILVFAVRTMFLWTLTILAPLAFASYILPATKGKIWDEWWKTLVQWSIFAIPVTFFMFLANAALTGVDNAAPGGTISTFAGFMAPFTALFILYLGVTTSQQMAPAAAKAVADWGKGRGLAMGGWAAREGWRKIGKKTEAGAGAVRKKGQDIAASAEARLKTENLGFGQKMGLRLARFGGKALSVTGGGVEMGSQKGNLAVSKRDKESIAKAEKDVGENSDKAFDIIETEEATGALKGGMLKDTSKELGAFTKIIKNGDTDKIEKRIKDGRMSWDFVRKMYKNSVDNGNVDQRRLIEKAFLSRALDKKDAQGNIIKDSNELGVSSENQEKIFEKIDGQDFKGVLGTESLDITTESGKMTMDEIIKHRGADLMPQFLRNANKEQRQAASQYLNDKGIQWFIDNNAGDVLRYSLSSGAASLGINPIGGITQEKLSELTKPKETPEKIREEETARKLQEEEAIEKLQEEIALSINEQARAQIELRAVPSGRPGKANRERLNKRIRDLEQRRDHAQAELTLRETSDDELKSNYQVFNEEFLRIQSRRRAGEILSDKDRMNMAGLRGVRDILDKELTRRKITIEASPTLPQGQPLPVPLQDQPMSVQIARLKEQEEQLKQTTGTPRTIRGVAIPMTRTGGVSYLPGEKAREERKKVQQKLRDLEERFYAAPPVLFEKEVELGRIEGEIIDNEKKIQGTEQDIATQQKLGATQQQIQQLEALKTTQQQEIQRLNQEKAEAITSWQGVRTRVRLVTPETAIAKDFAQTIEEEKRYSSQLAQQRTAKETEEKLRATRELLQHAGQTRQRAEQRITGVLRAQQLQRESRVAGGMRIPNFQTIVAQNEAEIQRIKQVEGDFDAIQEDQRKGLVHKPTAELTPQERQLIEDYEKDVAKLKKTEGIKKQISRLLKEEKKARS